MPVPRPLRRALSASLIIALAVALDVALVAGPAQASSRDDTKAKLSVSAPAVKAGSSVRITGTLTANGRALRGAEVKVQKRVRGKTMWVMLAKSRTNKVGRVSVRSAGLSRSQDFRLTYAGDQGTTAAVTAPVSVTALQKVAITSVSDLNPTAGDIVTIGGAAYAGIGGRRAFLQLQTTTGWTSVASTRVPTDGAFTITVRSMRGGEQHYRFFVVGDDGVVPASSVPQTFEVSAWYRLVDRAPLAPTSFFDGAQSIGGTIYEDSVSVPLTAHTSAYVDYDLDYSCRLLRTTFGPTDDSPDGFAARFTAKVDDARPIDMVVEKGSTWSETAEISGGQSLRLSAFADSGEGTAAWGDAEVLCVGAP